jgi:ankyrin repeat protein
MNFLNWLTNAFSDSSASSQQKTERTLDQAQENFFRAIDREQNDVIERIASKYPDFMTWRDAKDRSPLRHAQDSSSFQAFIQLVGLGADRHEDYGNGWTPLTTALAKNDPVFIDYLFDSKTAALSGVATSGEYSYTALHLAVLNRDEARVLRLIELGADQTVKAKPGKNRGEVTPEELAAQMKMPKIAEMLHLADEIRAVKAKELAELEAFAKANAYVPKGEVAAVSPFRGVPAPGGDGDKSTTIMMPASIPPAPAVKPKTP